MSDEISNALGQFVAYDRGNILASTNTTTNQGVIDSEKRNDISDYINDITDTLYVNSDENDINYNDYQKSEANALYQNISNLNTGIGIISVMQNALQSQIDTLSSLDEYTQALANTTNEDEQYSIRKDIFETLLEFDKIANTTTYNDKYLLADNNIMTFMQNHDIVSSATNSDSTGYVSLFESSQITNSGVAELSFDINGTQVSLAPVEFASDTNGIVDLAESINNATNLGGLEAYWSVESVGTSPIQEGTIEGLVLNGVNIGDVSVQTGDLDHNLIDTINKYTEQTGITASLTQDENSNDGVLRLTSDGSPILVNTSSDNLNLDNNANYGVIRLVDDNATTTIQLYDKNNVIDSGNFVVYNLGNIYDALLTGNQPSGDDISDISAEDYISEADLIDYASYSVASAQTHLSEYKDILDIDKQNFESEISYLNEKFLQSKINQDTIQKEEEKKVFDKSKLLADISTFAYSEDLTALDDLAIRLLTNIDTSMLPDDNTSTTNTTNTSTNTDTTQTSVSQNIEQKDINKLKNTFSTTIDTTVYK